MELCVRIKALGVGLGRRSVSIAVLALGIFGPRALKATSLVHSRDNVHSTNNEWRSRAMARLEMLESSKQGIPHA